MSPRERSILLEKLAQSVEKAMEQALTDKVTRAGKVLSPYYSKRIQTLLEELNAKESPRGNMEEDRG